MAAEVARRYAHLQSLKRELESREERRRDVESRADFLRFQLEEIERADLTPGEDEELETEAGRHEHAEEPALGTASVHHLLYGDDNSFDPQLRGHADALDEAFHLLSEIGRRVGDYASAVDHDPVRLEQVRERLDGIFRLKRKYGPELADVFETAQRVRTEFAELEEADHVVAELAAAISRARGELVTAAAELSGKRTDAAARLAGEVTTVLPELGLVGATFDVRMNPHDDVSSGGLESVEFLVAPNQGFDPMALSRIASGGELSRVMLALKAILASVDRVPVLVFDEIDAGVGGVVGTAVANKLAEVSRAHQVFVVSHLAQVASRADCHLLVEKAQGFKVTTASVRTLGGEARVEEIARMLGGDPGSETSRQHARELLAR